MRDKRRSQNKRVRRFWDEKPNHVGAAYDPMEAGMKEDGSYSNTWQGCPEKAPRHSTPYMKPIPISIQYTILT